MACFEIPFTESKCWDLPANATTSFFEVELLRILAVGREGPCNGPH